MINRMFHSSVLLLKVAVKLGSKMVEYTVTLERSAVTLFLSKYHEKVLGAYVARRLFI